MTKADSSKPPTKLEIITLKVFIHCKGCRLKVLRIIRLLDGVEHVTVDSASGKVTVTGTADVKTILQRLQKYGKRAEMWPSSIPPPPTSAGKAGANQPKPNINNKGSDSTNKNESKLEKSKEAKPEEVSNANTPTQNGGGGGGGEGKKGGKKGGNNNSNNNSGSSNSNSTAPAEVPTAAGLPAHDIRAPNTSIALSIQTANKSLAPYDSIQTGYSFSSAEYASHMFSDENANSCSIM